MDGGETTNQSCLASPPKQSKAKFDVTKCNKKIILGQEIKANKKIIMGRREYFFRNWAIWVDPKKSLFLKIKI